MKKIIILLLLFNIGKIKSQSCFGSPINYNAGSPFSVCSTDFNSDGKPDLAFCAANADSVQILLGTGTGTFGTPTSFLIAGNSPRSIITADFNGDGKADLAIANIEYSTSSVSVLLGNGAGNFNTATNYIVRNLSNEIISGDFNNDSKIDIAAVGSDSVSILLGTGLGYFSTTINFLADSGAFSLTSGDFNGDGNLDIATANYTSNNVSVLLGTGTGSFGTVTNYTCGPYVRSITDADFNGDGKIDLAVGSSQHNVYILMGNGVGGFGSITSYSAGLDMEVITTADYNADGYTDITTCNYGTGDVSMLVGDGTGNFAPAISYFINGGNPTDIINKDVNGDSKIDLIVSCDNSDISAVLLNCSNVGIESFNNEQIISIYPNPTNNHFFIDANTTDKLNVDLYDVNGRHVFSTNVIGKSNINVADLNEGVYTITIKTADHIINKKLVILR